MAAPYYPIGLGGLVRAGAAPLRLIMRFGHMGRFFVRAIVSIPVVLRHYRNEFLRLVSVVAWGNGSLIVGGGTAGIIIVLGASAGALVGIEGYSALKLLGLGPATGLISATASTRELAPIMASIAFASQAGCRFTAQLGAMRISEEIDAMETLAIRSIPYPVTTRLMAAVAAIVPLYLVCLAMNFVAVQIAIGVAGSQTPGTYEHYFRMVLSGTDIVYSLAKAVVFVIITTTIQCYYGYYSTGGPEGVGVAAGRAMRASITVMICVNLLLTLALWGFDSGARLSG
ncbi:ABC transporter permease [Nocardia macrotermitis]|uniref:Putative phospholipid ABC transporter permease protein MlaE n=1 Tax=Nocardia macrotermitis TaxID=2585198 RepID=A0A7K0CU37_9NOCA|nr:ABC transporter permease [Nocardia macrotermitis]MQY16990.1 putative phospholipid ABC transporter permease protein MlaE [Nocardia macrotermitis]